MLIFVFLFLARSDTIPNSRERAFIAWMRKLGVCYSGGEYFFRLSIFIENSRLIADFNRRTDRRFSLAHNRLSALTQSEYAQMLGVRAHDPRGYAFAERNARINMKLNDGVDWRARGAVTAVRDQGACGSCWAFSAIVAAEGANRLSSGQLVALSESNLVDCVFTCYGCSGGLMADALDYVIRFQGGRFMKQEDYPYAPAAGACRFDARKAAGSVSNYICVGQTEDELQNYVERYGPASCCINASPRSFQLYGGGIYDDPSCTPSYNHGVGCVGYSGNNGDDSYWIVKNSFGTSWGEEGYIRIAKNKNNMCGIASMALVVEA